MAFPDPSPKQGDTNNNLLFKIAQMLDAGCSGGGGGGVTSFNTRTGDIVLTAADVSAVADALYVKKSGDSMTGALAINNGTLVASAPALAVSQTWNNAAVTFDAATVNVTDTASNSSSRLLRLMVGGVQRFGVSKAGDVSVAASVTAASVVTTGGITSFGLLQSFAGLTVTGTVQLSANINTTSTTLSFFNVAGVVKQTSGANLTNNVTAGGTDNTIANFTDLTVYANDAAAIRNDIYQLARKLKQINDGLRSYGLFT